MRTRQLASLIVVGVLVTAAGLGAGSAADLWSRLGITESRAQSETVDGLASGYVSYGVVARAVMALPPAGRAALVGEGLAWVKGFVSSAAFKTAYAKVRAERKPEPPEAAGSADDQVKAQFDEQRRSIDEAKKNMALLPPAQRKELEPVIAQMEASLKQMAGDPALVAMLKSGANAKANDAKQAFQQETAAWEKNYPADGSVLVANRLRQFLNVCGNVDFSARLVTSGGKKRFADARNEEQPGEWKVCFRAGRETVDVVKAFATAWLAELPKK